MFVDWPTAVLYFFHVKVKYHRADLRVKEQTNRKSTGNQAELNYLLFWNEKKKEILVMYNVWVNK